MIPWLLSLLFGPPEEINGGERCPTYLYRWVLIRRTNWAIYVHRFVADDWSRDLHDHPKPFLSIGLWGSYTEETPEGEIVWRAPWVRGFPARHLHRLRLRSRVCWTLVRVGRIERQWGFVHKGLWIPWDRYVSGPEATAAKACD